MVSRIARFVARTTAVPAEDLQVSLRPLLGGLESSVMQATLRCSSGGSVAWPAQFVVKQLRGIQQREADIYRALWGGRHLPPAVQLLGIERCGGSDLLYLEAAESDSTWPWRETEVSAEVCRVLARLHDASPVADAQVQDWDYEGELARSAAETLEFAASARTPEGERAWTRLGDLRRVVGALPVIRARMRAAGWTVIHGDVHPGNVIVRNLHPERPVALIDWARARCGSPLEDVASWLHSLGCWEPEARRRHDTLLRCYLEARAQPRRLDDQLRDVYWYASASNGLAGAIRYHTTVFSTVEGSAEARRNSQLALTAWGRVIRRVAAILATTRSG